MKVRVYVKLKESVLDPQGEVIMQSLKRSGFDFVEGVRVGKFFDIDVSETEKLEERIREFTDKILANPIIEEYEIKIGE
jgi:phosphoribosylformylglycinamidine synthase